jgi:tetratricopeptide (TPR) repeat protein
MKAWIQIIQLGCIMFPATCVPAPSQARPQRPPALIRDTEKAEGKEEAEAAKEKEYNPILAAQNIKVGDYYLKRKNFDAAIERYLEALQYKPDSIDAYEALGRTYEKKGDVAKAMDVYRDFIRKNPDSPKKGDFQSKLSRLEKKSG